jgi:hypothetical protein
MEGDAMMKRYFPDKLSSEDRRTYKRWTRNLYLIYFGAVAVAVALGASGQSKIDHVASATLSSQGSSGFATGDREPAPK